jgi:hypothetical protein
MHLWRVIPCKWGLTGPAGAKPRRSGARAKILFPIDNSGSLMSLVEGPAQNYGLKLFLTNRHATAILIYPFFKRNWDIVSKT